MKKIIYIESFIDLEREYINQHNPYLIEEKLLYSFEKEELRKLIEETKKAYLKEKFPYSNRLERERIKMNYPELNEISKYFVDIVNYYFSWWEEVELSKKFLDRLTMFYKLHYETNHNYTKSLDIKKIPIREILSMYTREISSLKRNIKCPFPDHKDKSPSFKIYENSNSFYCYWCHRWWNILNLVSEMDWITTKEAYKKLIKLHS